MAAAQGPSEEVVQRQAADSPRTDDLVVQSATSPTGSANTAAPRAVKSAPLGGAELEEMARRLYEPLSSRLRAELWQDRERSGLLTDLRP